MSSAYVYAPPPLNYYNSPYLGPIAGLPPHTPIIPSTSLGNSPFIPSASLPGTSYGPPSSVGFPSTSPYAATHSLPPEAWVNERNRRLSWHGGIYSNPLPPQQTTQYLFSPPPSASQRRRSWGASDATYPVFDQPTQYPFGYWPTGPGGAAPTGVAAPYIPSYTPAPLPFPSTPQIRVHPFLNAEHPRTDFILNLASPEFTPMIYLPTGQTRLLSHDELNTPATYPAITYMRVECDLLPPQWGIDIAYNAQYASTPLPNPPPLTLGAVLSVIYYSLHVPITQEFWAGLDEGVVNEVSKAYTRRCRAMPSREMLLRNQGVKRVDFLRDCSEFKGLVRVPGVGGLERVKLIVG